MEATREVRSTLYISLSPLGEKVSISFYTFPKVTLNLPVSSTHLITGPNWDLSSQG